MQKRSIIISFGVFVFFLHFLLCIQKASCDVSASHIPAVSLLLLSSSSQPSHLELSHGIPLTYPGFEPQFRQLRVVKTDQNTYWVGMATTGTPSQLYLMQTDHLGRVLIPPFGLTELRYVGSSDSDYPFAFIPQDEGGLQVLASTRKAEDASYSDPDLLGSYHLNAQGQVLEERVFEHPYPYEPSESLPGVYLEDIWAFGTQNGQTLFVAETNAEDDLAFGRITDQGQVENATVLTGNWGRYNFVEAACDPEESKLYVLTFDHHYDNNCTTTLSIYNSNGSLESSVDISESIIQDIQGDRRISDIERPRLLLVDAGLLITVPNYYDDSLWLVLFDRETLSHQPPIQISGLEFDLDTADCRYALKDAGGGQIGLAWTHSNIFEDNFYPVLYARCSLDGEVTHGPLDLSIPAMHNDPRNPRLFLDGNRATLFYAYYAFDYEDERELHLVCRHQGLDFPEGDPDLAIARPQVRQSPTYATFNSQAAVNGTVFNMGESNSTPSTLTLNWEGVDYQAALPALVPGQSVTVSFIQNTPAYLTREPVYSLEVSPGNWPQNDQVQVKLNYPPSTPIYDPNHSGVYTWTVRDKVDAHRIPYAHYTLTLPNMNTVSGERQDIVLTSWSDDNGEFETVLPDGTYTFRLSRHGYPTTDFERTVPGPASSVFELEPPGNFTCTFADQDSSGPLHPAPTQAKVHLDNHAQGYEYYGRAIIDTTEDKLRLNDCMPGTYDAEFSSFAYNDILSQVDIQGGIDNPYRVEMTPRPRGRICGNVQGEGTPLDDAWIELAGMPLDNGTNYAGEFCIGDVPYGTYTMNVSAADYRSTTRSVTVDEAEENAGSTNLQDINPEEGDLEDWMVAMWNKVEEVPGTFFNPNYKVTCTYGVFDITNSFLSFEEIGEGAAFDQLSLNISGKKWYYYTVSSSFSLVDVFAVGLDEVVDGAGSLCAFIVGNIGFFDFLEGNIGGGGAGGSTVVCVDRAVLLENDTPICDSYDNLLQYYSEDGPITYNIGKECLDLDDVVLRLYMKVTNENYSIGPSFSGTRSGWNGPGTVSNSNNRSRS